MGEKAIEAPLVALVLGPRGAYVAGPGLDESWPADVVTARFVAAAREHRPRWVVWSAALGLSPIITAGITVPRTWDLAEVHRIVHGGWRGSPGYVWAAVRDLPEPDVPSPQRPRLAGFEGDLFDAAHNEDGQPFTAAGQLRPDALTSWATSPERLRRLALLALECQAHQAASLQRLETVDVARARRTAWSESAAAVLCLELERDGLPVDRLAAEDLISAAAGPRPVDEAAADRTRRARDRAVLAHAPGHERTDLRNPAQVRGLLAVVGVDVPNTRARVLEPYRQSHPLVDALLTWRKDERIATTYGYRWLDEHVGADDRLRGEWTACDGAAGRMTAQHGLHNLPAQLRPAVCARAGHVFVRTDLGQVEPRVLAVVSGDPALAEATRSDDLYAPVARRLGSDRPTAKVAVLAAMYGQRSGAAGAALAQLERAYPVAMGLLDRAYADGVAGRSLRTYGGRLIRLDAGASGMESARGRYARNAIIQGSAAELFKAWAATVRVAVAQLGGQIVLCLHDELLVHVPESRATEAAALIEGALQSAARVWAGADRVRFVADTSIVRRWSDAKD
ncbi:MAG: DNA polymerase [Intrasporangium sp.]|uniref:DNA polymerase n=1 Tax=Intrasporangium sp. TaxID=1925024 RepID=UPI002649F6CC|nr:DNA polymerase [Intrasporangium sp.]MDN5795256.1 DNA polymerase [Intrasporangium sp.]